jgi:hypothetical protein
MTPHPVDAELAEMDEELAEAKASLRRLRERTLREFSNQLEGETNPYFREFLIKSIRKVSGVGAES